MTALIPLNLTDALQPEELGELLDLVAAEQRSPEAIIIASVREYLATHKATDSPAPNPLPTAA